MRSISSAAETTLELISYERCARMSPIISCTTSTFELSRAFWRRVPRPSVPGTPLEGSPLAPVAVASNASNAEVQQQLAGLQDALKQLQAEKTILEAKLKEALATQPAVIDPRELAKAQEKVQALLKENELLKAGLEQDKSRPAAVSTKELEDARRMLAGRA